MTPAVLTGPGALALHPVLAFILVVSGQHAIDSAERERLALLLVGLPLVRAERVPIDFILAIPMHAVERLQRHAA